MPSEIFIEDSYQELHELEYSYRTNNDINVLEENLKRLNFLENEISSTWIEGSKLGNSYTLRNSLARIKSETAKKIEGLKAKQSNLQ